MVRSPLLLVFVAILFTACYSKKKSIEASLPYSEKINWPERYMPAKASFFVHNEIEVNASPQVVWDLLTQAEAWPDWYEGAADVKVQDSDNGVLKDNSLFTWQTMGLNFKSAIKEFAPPERLSWESRKRSIKAYHAWLIIPTEYGCKIITDESQYGWLTFLEKTFQANKLRKLHDVWLREIKAKAEKQ